MACAIAVTSLILPLASTSSGAAFEHQGPLTSGNPVAVAAPENCREARLALTHYERIVREYRRKTGARSLPATADVPAACPQTRLQAKRWRVKARAARRAYRRWWHYAWREWMPAFWQGIARCEEHYDFSYHSALYVSTFAISRREYDADAAVFGAPAWNDAHPPTPRQQYLAALGHAHRFGLNGWGCYTNGGYRA